MRSPHRGGEVPGEGGELRDDVLVDIRPRHSEDVEEIHHRKRKIIDRHGYRAIYGENYPLHSRSTGDAKIDLYCDYLDRLFALADLKKADFEILDRVLYVFDKQVNGKL